MPTIETKINEWLARADKMSLASRLWDKDAGLWTKDPACQTAIRERLGWLAAPREIRAAVGELEAFAEEVRSSGFAHAVLLGMGGASLTSEVFQAVLGNKPGYPKLLVLDSTDPGKIADVEKSVAIDKTLFIVSSKSGGTLEVDSLFKYFFEKTKALKTPGAGGQFIAITDPGTPLEELAGKNAFRKIFLAPADVGGRFSALTYFGLVPAAIIGADLEKILDSADKMSQRTRAGLAAKDNAAMALGVGMAVLAEEGRDKLTLLTAEALEPFGDWAEQLVAESTGKEGSGIIPVVRESRGEPGAYGEDRFFAAIRFESPKDADFDAYLKNLENEGHPVLTLRIAGREELGGEFFRWEMATAIAGALLKINPFDQPDVQAAKDRTKATLKTFESGGELRPRSSEMPESFWENLKTKDYISILAFLPDREPIRRQLAGLQRDLRDLTRLAVTLGFGPRYLHSTGQLHKGGPPSGVFILITAAPSEDLAVPGEKFSFGQLELAQALGDWEALKGLGRRALHFHLESLSEESLGDLCDKITEAVRAQC